MKQSSRRCRLCRGVITAVNRSGYCYHCSGAVRCSVCSQPSEDLLKGGTICRECKAAKVSFDLHSMVRPPEAEVDARVAYYAARAALELPLFAVPYGWHEAGAA